MDERPSPRSGAGTPASPASALSVTAVESVPVGILVTARNGAVILANPPARTLLRLRGGPSSDAPLTCCSIFGCRRVPELADRCLTESAVGGQSEDLHVQLKPVQGEPIDALNAVSVTSSPAGDDAGAAIVVRPVERRSRAAGAERGGAAARLHFKTFGRLTIVGPDGPVGGPWLSQRPGELLRLLLAHRDRVLHPDELAEALWVDADRSSSGNVRYHVHLLRDRLEPQRERREPSAYVRFERGGYFLDRRLIEVDADRFEHRVAAGLAARNIDDLTAAVEMYRGEFLADEPYAEWALAERDRHRSAAGDALRALEELHMQSGDIVLATRVMTQLAELDNLDFDVQRRLIELNLLSGRRTEAHRRYRALQMRVRKYLGEELPFTLADVAARR
jgi:DNA-binding SARP family transcriptional activator